MKARTEELLRKEEEARRKAEENERERLRDMKAKEEMRK